jgi:hypothetical protein
MSAAETALSDPSQLYEIPFLSTTRREYSDSLKVDEAVLDTVNSATPYKVMPPPMQGYAATRLVAG